MSKSVSQLRAEWLNAAKDPSISVSTVAKKRRAYQDAQKAAQPKRSPITERERQQRHERAESHRKATRKKLEKSAYHRWGLTW